MDLEGDLVVAAADLSVGGSPVDAEQVIQAGGLEQLFTFFKQTHSAALSRLNVGLWLTFHPKTNVTKRNKSYYF